MNNVYFKKKCKGVQNWNVDINDICTLAHTIVCILTKVLKE